MKTLIKYSSIGSYRVVLEDLRKYCGKFETSLPIVTATWTEKIDGINIGVSYNDIDGIWVQSRKEILNKDNDKLHAWKHVMDNSDKFKEFINYLAFITDTDLTKYTITINYEWCDTNPYDSVDDSTRYGYLFQHYKITHVDNKRDTHGKVIRRYVEYPVAVNGYINKIYVLNVLNSGKLPIDFNNPNMEEVLLGQLTASVLDKSKVWSIVRKEDVLGEGVVCTFVFKDELYKLKLKGKRHSKSFGFVKKIIEEDIDLNNTVKMFVEEYACVDWRLEQMFNENLDVLKSRKDVGRYIKLVMDDIWKEETLRLEDMGLTRKVVNKSISMVIKNYFMIKF